MEPLPQELLSLEQQLRSFVPQTPQTSREQMLYQAGWDAALAQQGSSVSPASPATLQENSPRSATNQYWAAACAALVVLSTTLAWQVWQQPDAGATPSIVTATPVAPALQETPTASQTPHAPPLLIEEPILSNNQPSPLASYLELRERVTRGGLSMWSVSTPVRNEPNDVPPRAARDWQAELLREIL